MADRSAIEMKYRRLGRTGLDVSLLSLGTGGPNRFGQLRYSNKDSIFRLVRRALDSGINFFDTASGYEQSEERLGQALQGLDRSRFIVASKVRPLQRGSLIDASTARLQVEQSLTRLKLDQLQILQLHGVTMGHYRESLDRLMPELDKLRDEGKIRFIGITESSLRDPQHVMLQQAVQDNYFDTVMVSYHLGKAGAEKELLPMTQRNDVGVIAMTSARQLTDPGMPERLKIASRIVSGLFAYPPRARLVKHRLGEVVRTLGKTAKNRPGPIPRASSKSSLTLPAAGYTFAASHPAIATVLTGTTNPEHLDENVAAALAPALTAHEAELLRQSLD